MATCVGFTIAMFTNLRVIEAKTYITPCIIYEYTVKTSTKSYKTTLKPYKNVINLDKNTATYDQTEYKIVHFEAIVQVLHECLKVIFMFCANDCVLEVGFSLITTKGVTIWYKKIARRIF